MKKVVVIGGGVSGIGAALALQERIEQGAKVDYVLIEKSDYLGGKVVSVEVDGFLIEGGPDCFIAEKPWVGKMAEKLGIEDRLLPSSEASKGTFVFSGKRLQSLPEGMMLMMPTKIVPFALSRLISWPGKFRMALDLIIPRKKDDSDESLGDFVRRRLGQEALDKIAEPLIGGIHAGNPETMSLKASFPRFLQMEQKYGSLIRGMMAGKKAASNAPKPKLPNGQARTQFMTFKKGMGEVVGEMLKRVPKNKILMGKTVTSIKENKVSENLSRYTVKVQGMEPIEADAVVIATPANIAGQLTKEFDKALAEKLASIPFASTATVSLGFRKRDVPVSLASYGFVIPAQEGRKIMAVTYSSSKWNERTPDDDHVLIRAFVGGAKNSELVQLSDKKMLKMVKDEVNEIMGIEAEPVVERIFRWEKGMPQYIMGHLERVAEIDQRTAQHPGLYLVGGSYRGVGVGDCMNQGAEAANKAIELLQA